jgi:hypothetical protein
MDIFKIQESNPLLIGSWLAQKAIKYKVATG